MYNRIGYIYFILSLVAHLAVMYGVVAIPSSSNEAAAARHPVPGENIQIKLYEAPRESPALITPKEKTAIEEKKEVFLPEKKYLDFSDIPAGKKPEKAQVQGKVSTEASNDFYRKKADKVQQSKTVVSLPSSRVRKLLVRKPKPSLDARRPQQLSPPARKLPPAGSAPPPTPPQLQEGEGIKGELDGRELKARIRQPGVRLMGPEYDDIQRPQKQETVKETNIYARLEPAPGEQGRNPKRLTE